MRKILFISLMSFFYFFNMAPLDARGAVGGGHGGFGGDRGGGFREGGFNRENARDLYQDDRFYQDERRDLEDSQLSDFDDYENYDGYNSINPDENFPDNEVPDEAEAIYEYNQ